VAERNVAESTAQSAFRGRQGETVACDLSNVGEGTQRVRRHPDITRNLQKENVRKEDLE